MSIGIKKNLILLIILNSLPDTFFLTKTRPEIPGGQHHCWQILITLEIASALLNVLIERTDQVLTEKAEANSEVHCCLPNAHCDVSMHPSNLKYEILLIKKSFSPAGAVGSLHT